MKTELSVSGPSVHLTQFYAGDDVEAVSHLTHLLEQEARPVLAAAVRKKLTSLAGSNADLQQEVEDLVQDGLVRIAQQLIAGRNGEAQIKSVGGYSARVAEYACDEFFRSRYRKRYNAMKRVLVNLKENPSFYEWKFNSHSRHGALSGWPPPPPISPASRSTAIRHDLNVTTSLIFRAYFKGDLPEKPGTATCLNAALIWAEGALDVDDLVLVLQCVRNEFDATDRALDPEVVVATTPEFDGTEVDFLRAIWSEIKKLRPGQAKALLLNLRIKGESVIEVFADSDVASIVEMSDKLEFDYERFKNEILEELPWSDKRVADHLQCTEEQVSALRSTARRTIATRIISSKQFSEECFRFHL